MNPSLFLLAATLAIANPALAHDHAEHSQTGATPPAAAQANMEKVWKEALARQPLAAMATFDAGGRLWLAKVQGGHVLVSRSDNRGKTFGPAVKVNPEPENIAADGENRPKILVARNGNIYVAWTRSLEKPMTGHIRFSRSVDGGKTFSAPVIVNDNHEVISHRFDAMAVNERGQIYIAWLDKRDLAAAQKKGEKYSGAAVYYAVSDDDGATFRPNAKAADHTCECCRVAMAVDADDIPVVTWRHIFENNVRDHALLKLDGVSQPSRMTFDDWRIEACPHHGPALAIGDDGVYHATWFNDGGLFYANSEDCGKTFSVPFGFGGSEAQPSHPYVVSFRKNVFLAWKEFDGKNSIIRAMVSADGGDSWSPPRKLAATAGASDHPLLIRDGEKVYLSWNTAKEGFRLIEVTAKTRAKSKKR
ncbi:MAG: sialidase family protein [Pseudomonadota bacterium]